MGEPLQPAIAPPSDTSTSSRQDDNSDCQDTLADSPSCTFGGLCDCETFVNAPESSGCDGFYSSPMGDVEVRSVCAKYCGCDVTIDIEEAIGTAGDDCVDALDKNPACTFGGLCDCETFVNAPESTGCGGVYTSPMGDIAINDVCANYCGCEGGAESSATTTVEEPPVVEGPPAGGPPPSLSDGGGSSPMGCADSLAESPMCRFAGICECEEFVNAPEAEGCGGLYKSEFGDVTINDVCAQYCNACVDRPLEEIFEEAYLEVMTHEMREKCQYATADCQAMLSNLYSCASGQSGIEQAHPMVQAVVTKRGQEVALSSALLGDASLHAGEEPQAVEACGGASNDVFEGEFTGTERLGTPSGAASRLTGSLMAAMMMILATSMVL